MGIIAPTRALARNDIHKTEREPAAVRIALYSSHNGHRFTFRGSGRKIFRCSEKIERAERGARLTAHELHLDMILLFPEPPQRRDRHAGDTKQRFWISGTEGPQYGNLSEDRPCDLGERHVRVRFLPVGEGGALQPRDRAREFFVQRMNALM